MPWVTEEEIQAAKNMTAYEYLRTHQAQRLQKTRTRNEWQLTDHDSFKINELSSKWHWKSRDIGGVSALRFLIEVDGMKFTDAVKLLCEESPSFIPTRSVEREKLPFKLPERYCNCRRIRAYLNHRGISDEVITYCISHEILYESVPYHNAVFVGKDESRKARYAFLRGIYEKNGKGFKMEQTGSEKKYSFCIPPERETKRVAVYEACIDALAHMTLEEGKRDKYRLSLGGIAAPKENALIQSERFKKPPDALEEFLKNHLEIKEIEICTDNDFAGRWAKEQMKKHYEGTYQIICNLPEKEGEDYADLAKEKKQANKCRDRPLERR